MATVQAKLRLYVPCPSCIEGSTRADQLPINQSANWTCNDCRKSFYIKRLSETDFETYSIAGKKDTPVVITLESVTEPKITLKLNTWKYSYSQNDTKEEYDHHSRYFYDEHTCPTNWVHEIIEIIFEGDHDPHGVFRFVSAEDGHMVDSPTYGRMVISSESIDH